MNKSGLYDIDLIIAVKLCIGDGQKIWGPLELLRQDKAFPSSRKCDSKIDDVNLQKISSATGSRTPLSPVTGEDTNRYTIADWIDYELDNVNKIPKLLSCRYF